MMLAGLLLDLTLAAVLLVLAWRSIAVRSLFAGAVLYIVFGAVMAIVWLRLGAPDVALAEAGIGAGLTGVLLLGALAALASDGASPEPARPVLAVLCTALAIGLGLTVTGLPDSAIGLADRVLASRHEAGVANPVTAVLLDFRAYDTLLETAVLLLALLGVWALANDAAWGGIPGGAVSYPRPEPQLLGFVRLMVPMAILLGGYLLWVGTGAPGGAFQAATLLAAAGVMTLLAGIARPPPTRSAILRTTVVAGLLGFLAVGASALPAGRAYLDHPAGSAKTLIIVTETLLSLSIAATLALLAAGPPQQPAGTKR